MCRLCKSEYHRNYYKSNKERVDAVNKAWISENRDRSRNIKKKWTDSNKDKQAAAIKKWQIENKERFDKTKKEWALENKERLRIHCMNRRRKLAGGKLSQGIVQILTNKQQGLCAGCGKPLNGDYHIDHIHPISKGGANTDDNVQLLHSRCNLIKSAKFPWEVEY